MKLSPLQVARYQYSPKLPGMLRNGISDICVCSGGATESVADQEKIKALFPNTYGKNEITFQKGKNTSAPKKQIVGVILSGGQAPGGHNVICGLYDALKACDKENVLYGFKGGPSGLLEDNYLIFDDEYINQYRNTGGFDIIGSGRTKLETEEQFAVAEGVCRKHGITAIVIIGGDDSNTNAAVLAEYFAAHNSGIQVIGCPKTIDGDLKNEDIECSFGFDTATKTYSEIIGNIERDANSAKKYWHFVKVMGRSASHVALECALETQPNICLIGEEVAEKKMSLAQIADYIADSVATRAAKGWNFGVAIIPEGIVEFVPEFSVLIAEINELLAGEKTAQFNALPTWEEKYAFIKNGLTKQSMDVFAILPQSIQQQLFLERDPFLAVAGRKDLNGLEKLREVIRLHEADAEQQQLGREALPMLKNPRVLAEMLETNRRELSPRFLKLIEEGRADGSIRTDYAPELAELIPLLTSLWLAPTVYPATAEGLRRKFRLIGEMLTALGLPLVDESVLSLADEYISKL